MASRVAAVLQTSVASGVQAPPANADKPVNDGGPGLRTYLVERYATGKMPTTEVCTFALHASAAGASGVSDIACHPDSRHHAEHLMKALGTQSREKFYVGKVPMWNHEREERDAIYFPVTPPSRSPTKTMCNYCLHMSIMMCRK